jgi:hypothetical protein
MKTDILIPRMLRDKVDQELEPGETIQWMDMPVPRYFTPSSTAAFLFAIPWTAFAVFWMFGASGFKIPDFSNGFSFFPLFGLPFVLVGLGMLCSPFMVYRKSFRTVYILTNKRAITIDGGWSTTIRSYSPSQLQWVYRKERSNGSGDVIMARRAWRDSDGDRQTEDVGFIGIRNPKEVEQLVKKLAERAIHVDNRSGGER